MLQPGDKVGSYEVEALIADGATAHVYRVRHPESGVLRALKHLRLAGSEVREAMIREAALQSSLRHPNIVHVHEVLELDGDPALIMDLVSGPTLEDHLARGHLPIDEAEALFGGIAAAVGYAHSRGVLHLDLKPSNILLEETPDGLLPRVSDFGVGAALGAPDGGGMGTPAYAAPERIRGGSKVDSRADIFSLGCILYELVVGRRAFTGTDALVVLDEVVSVRYTPAEHLRPGLPRRVLDAIQAPLQSDPIRRAPNIDTLIAILAGDEEAAARTAAQDQWAWARGSGSLWALVVFGLLLVAVAVYYASS